MSKYTDAVQLWQSYSIRSESDIDLRLGSFRILFAFNSSKIENANITYHDTREIFENGKVLNYTGDTRAIFEIQNQKRCYEYLKAPIAARTPITTALIREVHGILTAGTYDERRFIDLGERPGEFKKHDFVTGIGETGALPEDVESEMAELLEILDESEDKDPLKLAAFFHLRFEYIHPFADGNGRVGRTLMNYCLMIRNHPPLVIYEEDKEMYYRALEAYDTEEEMQPMADFLAEQLGKTWEKAVARERRRSR